mgnify:FL=1|tara:strand:+ start:1487 stop:1855 length:369 start_codon:yes stop_codon:yes gene_type:complete
MPSRPTSSPKQFIQGAPVLHVEDVQATAEYYHKVLGFTWDFGDENYSVVWRDNSAIDFTKGDRNSSGVDLFQWVEDVDVVYKEMTEKGASMVVEIGDREYGIRDFKVIDPNGVGVIFGEDIA